MAGSPLNAEKPYKRALPGCGESKGILQSDIRPKILISTLDEWADDRFLRLAVREMKAKGQWTSDKLPGFPKELRPDKLKKEYMENLRED